MRRSTTFVITAGFALAAFGEGPLDCIDPDVLHALLMPGQGARAPTFSAEVPAELSGLKMPREFTWIGSAKRTLGMVDANTPAGQVTAAYATNLGQDAARAAVGAALGAAGWQVRSMGSMGNGVFVSGASPFQQVACREGQSANVNTNVLDGRTYVLFSIQLGGMGGNSICNQPPMPDMPERYGFGPGMPRLEMPVDPATGQAALARGGSSGGGGGAANFRTEFVLQDSAGNVGSHFARQMAAQGWLQDAQWSGASTAGSAWSKRADGGSMMRGVLHVTDFGSGHFQAALRVTTLQ